jgi:hypothetical protein
MHLEWAKTASGDWLELETVDLSTLHQLWGVYVIWVPHPMPSRPGTVLKVGSGNIAVRLAYERAHRIQYLPTAPTPLLVTWAEVQNRRHSAGVVRYLTQHLQPVWWNQMLPECEPVRANLPLPA